MSLRERRAMLQLADAAPRAGVLMTVVSVAGSSYRRPGARLLHLPDGRIAGTISGGCLEAELLQRGAWMVRDGAVIETFNTAADEDGDAPYGLGCGGVVSILLEDAATDEAAAAMDALQATVNGEARTIITRLPNSEGHASSAKMPLARIVMDTRGDVLFASDHLPTEDVVDLRSDARNAITRAGVFVEHLPPAQRLILFGAGEDAKPMARLAAEMGWTVIVSDTRAARATADRFPQAERIVVGQSAHEVPVLPTDCVVLMTHSFVQDGRLLAELLPLRPRYLGLLGAAARSALLLSQVAALSGISSGRAEQLVHAPIGLPLGGDGPEAVALATVAQIQQILCRTTGETPGAPASSSQGELAHAR